MKKIIFPTILFVFSNLIVLLLCEGMLRFKNRDMKNYDIEMWRYATTLKRKSENPIINHEHIRSKKAMLQSVEIQSNNYGLRGQDISLPLKTKRNILFLGGSITLGWGVLQKDTVTEQLMEMLQHKGEEVAVWNAGVANYNTSRYVELFLTRLKELKPTDIVVHYFLRDAALLKPSQSNLILEKSQLAITFWNLMTRTMENKRNGSLEEYYHQIYNPTYPGFLEMKDALQRLAKYCHEQKIRMYFAMIPEVHELKNYKFSDIHSMMRDIVEPLGFIYIDLFPALSNLTPQDLWVMPGDSHPNALGHRLMAKSLFQEIQLKY